MSRMSQPSINGEGEMIRLADADGNFVNMLPRGEEIPHGLFRCTAQVIIFNSKGEVLICKRSMKKKRSPGRFNTSAAGHVNDETWEEAAHKELLEETGIRTSLQELFFYQFDRRWVRVYVGVSDGPVHINDESESYTWILPQDLEHSIKAEPENYTLPSAESFIKLFKKIKAEKDFVLQLLKNHS